MYQPDPASTLRRLASHLKPGGIVAFGEYNITPDAMRAPSDMPLTGKLFSWIDGAFRHAVRRPGWAIGYSGHIAMQVVRIQRCVRCLILVAGTNRTATRMLQQQCAAFCR